MASENFDKYSGLKRPIDESFTNSSSDISQIDNGGPIKRPKICSDEPNTDTVYTVSSDFNNHVKTTGVPTSDCEKNLLETTNELDEKNGCPGLGEDQVDDNDDNVSELSALSDFSMEAKWTQTSIGAMIWIQRQMARGINPRVVLRDMVLDETEIPDEFDDATLWKIIASIVSEPPRRKRLENVSSFDDVVRLIKDSKKIIVLTGAGVSVSCGIPDFRSRNGIYVRLAVDYPDLPDPQAMFDIQYFKKNPNPFFKFAKEIYPGQFAPSPSHKFIHLLEKNGSMLRNYTQNIDTLEFVAGITRVVQCHGSFATATCMNCKHQVDSESIRDDIMNQIIPKCPNCGPEVEFAILKPDIVFFGESLSEEFHRQIDLDKEECDLLIVMGSSLKVRPVAIIPSVLPPHVPQILINRESLKHLNFDVELLGDCDVIVNELCHRLGDNWTTLCTSPSPAVEIQRDELPTPPMLSPETVCRVMGDGVPLHNEAALNCDKEVSTNGIAGEAISESSNKLDGDQCINQADATQPHVSHKPRPINLSSILTDNNFMYIPPRRYVFHGAEIYENEDDNFDDSSDSSDSEDGEMNSSGELALPSSPGELALPSSPGELALPSSPGELALPSNPSELPLPSSPGELALPSNPSELPLPSSPRDMDLLLKQSTNLLQNTTSDSNDVSVEVRGTVSSELIPPLVNIPPVATNTDMPAGNDSIICPSTTCITDCPADARGDPRELAK